MTHARRLACAGAVLAAAALLIPAGTGSAAARATKKVDPVAITVKDISPSTPTPTKSPTPLTVTLTLTNTTNQSLANVSVLGERGVPIGTQDALDAMLANPTPPASSGISFASRPPVTLSLDPHTAQDVTFTTSTTTLDHTVGICLCAPHAVYPLFFSAHRPVNGVDQLLGVTATYLPAFDTKDFRAAAPVRVSWIWPLLDRPHRLTQDTVFTDDALAAKVAPDGRLSRALDVVAEVADLSPPIPITLLIDPDLLDELEVMANASAPYTVMTANGKTVPGTGQAAASDWLTQLHSVLANPQVQVELTPYGDPDVESLTARGLRWSGIMPASMVARVTTALSGRPIAGDLAWPPTGAISRSTLRTLASQGVTTLVLNSAAVRTGAGASAVSPGIARLSLGPNHDVAAVLTSPAIESFAADAVTLGGHGSAALPRLLAELAIRPAQDPEAEHPVTITAPRYVNPDVTAAVRTIQDTSSSVFARPISLAAAVSDGLQPIRISHLVPVPASATAHAFETMNAAADARDSGLPTIRSLLDTSDAGAASFEESLPVAIQRAESAAWRSPRNAAAATRFAQLLKGTVHGITSGVQIVQSAHTYTFGSNTAPLPITVDNALPYPVHIRIAIVGDPPVLGFHAKNIGKQSVEATQKRTFNIPTTIEHAGRIRIQASLLTGNGTPLNSSIQMTVRSTALGLIGVVITIVAGVVLGLALLWRLLRRLRHRRASGGPPAVARVPEPEPVG